MELLEFGYQNTNLERVSGEDSHLGAGTFFARAFELTFLLDILCLLEGRSQIDRRAKYLKYKLVSFSAKQLLKYITLLSSTCIFFNYRYSHPNYMALKVVCIILYVG